MSSHNVQEELQRYGAQPRGSVAMAAQALVVPLTHSVVLKTTDGTSDDALSVANGVPGQELTITLVTDGGKDADVTPATLTGFVTVALDDAKDTVTLKYIDDTIGWIVIGATGTAAPPVIT